MQHLLTKVLFAFLILLPLSASAQQGSEVQLRPQEWRRFNLFFSNFAESSVQPFRRGDVPLGTLLHFGVLHNVINADQRIQKVPGRPNHARLSATHVEKAVMKYFGLALHRHQSISDDYSRLEYANGYYIFPISEGEFYPFAQVERLTDVGGGEFTATLSIYQSVDEGMDSYGTPVERLRRSGYEIDRLTRMRARIRRVREAGQERYVLLEYLRAE